MGVAEIRINLNIGIRLHEPFYQRYTSMVLSHSSTSDELTVCYQPGKYEIAPTDARVWEDVFDDVHQWLCRKFGMMFTFFFFLHYCMFECGSFKLIMVIRSYESGTIDPNDHKAVFHSLKFDSYGVMGYDTWVLDQDSVLFIKDLDEWLFPAITI